MNALVDEFQKIADDRARQLLSLDPERLDMKDPEHRQLVEEKQRLLTQLRTAPAGTKNPYQRMLSRQMILEGLKAPLLIGAGAGLGYGLGELYRRNRKLREFMRSAPGLTLGAVGLAGLSALVLARAKQQEQERRLNRAYSILPKPRTRPVV
jgi:hypothetical protein